MKPMDAMQALNLLPKLERFEAVASPLFWQKGDIRKMIEVGDIVPTFIMVNNAPKYLAGHHLTDDGGLWIDLLQEVSPGGEFEDISRGIDLLAQQTRSRYIRFYTPRRGLATRAQVFGYQPEAVLLSKAVA